MDLKIYPITHLKGEITAPPSKSYSHRAFIIASLANGISIIRNPSISGDVKVTINILENLGVKILKEEKSNYIVEKTKLSFKSINKVIDCKNSGTSIRIFSALSLLIENGLSLTGEFLRRKRPIKELLYALKSLGGEYEIENNILHIERKEEKCDSIKIRGDISSQFITALLILTPILKCNKKNFIELELTTDTVSFPYIDITLDVIDSFGINLFDENNKPYKKGKYYIICGQNYRPQSYEIPGDFSSAAFIIAASVLSPENSEVIINNLDMQNPQGDKKIIEILKEMGAQIQTIKEKKQVIVKGNIKKFPLKGIEIDCKDIPDLFPILSIIGAFAHGKTVLYNASNLRIKESDRISGMARELKKMGANVEEEEDKLIIYHCDNLKGILINHEMDHRVAMACCIAALYAKSFSQISYFDVIKDSYPYFKEDLEKLGAKFEKL
ncbi:MAG: 3-phosphoshikimate 1-carboxyvinyltransferase [Promethearchaeota archaeon]